MKLLVAIALVAALAVTARADDAKVRAARGRLDAMVRLLADGKFDDFAAQFPDTERSAVMFPSSRFASTGRKAIRTAAPEWLGVGRTASAAGITGTPVVGTRADGDAKRSGHLVVISADLTVTVKENAQRPFNYRVTAVLSDQLDPARPSMLVPTAMFISLPVDEKDLRGEDNLGESGELDRFLDLLRVPDLLADTFDAGDGDIVIGTASGERATGTEAKAMLKRWHERKYALVGKPHIARQLDWVYAMGTMSWTRKSGKPAPINVLLVGYPECKKTCTGTDMTPHVVALHFGQAR